MSDFEISKSDLEYKPSPRRTRHTSDSNRRHSMVDVNGRFNNRRSSLQRLGSFSRSFFHRQTSNMSVTDDTHNQPMFNFTSSQLSKLSKLYHTVVTSYTI
jgi:hypothetical protein